MGWIELAVQGEGVVGDLLAGVAAEELVEQVAAIHTHSVREVYTIISAGPAVQTIIAAGAADQRSEPS